MQKFFKIFLIFLYAFFALGINNCEAQIDAKIFNTCNLQLKQEQNSTDTIIVSVSTNNTTIAASNNYGYEISALKPDKDSNCCNLHNQTSNNNLAKQIFRIYTNKILNNKSHNISPIIAYEICTRAP